MKKLFRRFGTSTSPKELRYGFSASHEVSTEDLTTVKDLLKEKIDQMATAQSARLQLDQLATDQSAQLQLDQLATAQSAQLQLDQLATDQKDQRQLPAHHHKLRSFEIAQRLKMDTSTFEAGLIEKVNGLALHDPQRPLERSALLAFRTAPGDNPCTIPTQVLRYTTGAPPVEEPEKLPVTVEAARALPENAEVTFSTFGCLDASRRPQNRHKQSERDGDLEIKLTKLPDDKISVKFSFGYSPSDAPHPLELGNRRQLIGELWHEMCALTQVNSRQTELQESFTLDLSTERGAQAFESIFKRLPESLRVDLATLDKATSNPLGVDHDQLEKANSNPPPLEKAISNPLRVDCDKPDNVTKPDNVNLARPEMFGNTKVPITARDAQVLANGDKVTFYTRGILDAKGRPPDQRSWMQKELDLEVKLHKLSHNMLSVSVAFIDSPVLERSSRRYGGLLDSESFILDLSKNAQAYESIFRGRPGPVRFDLHQLNQASVSQVAVVRDHLSSPN